MSKEKEKIESWSIDFPLEEFTMEMAAYPSANGDTAKQAKHVATGKVGSTKADRSKPRKKNATRRSKS